MLVTRTSSLSGLEHELELPITTTELTDLEFNEESTVWDKLDIHQSEFLLEGVIQSEYLERFKE